MRGASPGELQVDFEKATFEGAPAASHACALCRVPLTDAYFMAGQAMVCEPCSKALAESPPGGAKRFLKALAFGSGAGLVGAIVYGLIIYATDTTFALATIAIGWLVGRAMQMALDHRGSLGYQLLAVVLTYLFCMEAFVPSMMREAGDGGAVPMVFAVMLAPALPFFGGMDFLGLLILGFGLWQAFRMPAKLDIVVSGPFSLVAPAQAAPVLAPAGDAANWQSGGEAVAAQPPPAPPPSDGPSAGAAPDGSGPGTPA